MSPHRGPAPAARRLPANLTPLVALALACTYDAPTAPPDPVRVQAAVVVAEDAFTGITTEPFGAFGGVAWVRHTGRFAGTTELGDFDVPFEVVAPADPARGSGALLLEPPHFAFGTVGRDGVLGRDLIFGAGIAYAAVGFGTNGLNVLDPTAPDPWIAGEPVATPGAIDLGGLVDEEILIQFVTGLTTTGSGVALVGPVALRLAYGISQTSGALMETLHHPDAQGLFDFTLLHLALWHPPFAPSGVLDRLPATFAPVEGVGRVAFVGSEGDLLVSQAMQFRSAVPFPEYRVYEVAGAAHVATPLNPLDHAMVARAIFAGGFAWARGGPALTPSRTLSVDGSGADDPVYGFPTGILRDADLNALGGVRLPELEIGTARFIAANLAFDPFPPLGLFGLVGGVVDLTCAPRPGEQEPRFRNHGAFMKAFARQASALASDGLLLPEDAEEIKDAAGASGVGLPGSCGD